MSDANASSGDTAGALPDDDVWGRHSAFMEANLRRNYTTNLTHELALFKAHCGRTLPGLPSVGAWVTYGLGTENRDLPAYVVLDDPIGLPVNGIQSWQSGFLPPQFQGTRFRAKGTPVLNLRREFSEPDAITLAERAFINEIDERHRRQRKGQANLEARIASYQLAARMQLATTDALNLQKESAQTQRMYGVGRKESDSYARRCLIARRLVERGVPFVTVNNPGWDTHTNAYTRLKEGYTGARVPIGLIPCLDMALSALIDDLQNRQLLDQTLVVVMGEFGRTPKLNTRGGRDH